MAADKTKPAPNAQSESIWLMYEMNGGVISKPDLAVKIGEALCETHYGTAELQRQKPLVATDKGTYWRVEGSWNRDGKIDDKGAFFLSIQKRDGLITDLGQWAPVPRGFPGSLNQLLQSPPKETDKSK